jgi:hypothetical protein
MFLYVLELSKSQAKRAAHKAHKETCVCPQGEEVHARKWKLYAATQQDTA